MSTVPETRKPATPPESSADDNATSSPVVLIDDTEEGYVTGVRLAVIIGSVSLACFLMLVDTMIISTAIPRITDTFNSLPDVGCAAPQPLTGKIYTHFNLKWSFLFFFGVFELGSVLCGAAVSSNMLIVGRAVAGIGAAGLINGSITIISACAPMARRPVNSLGLVVGPLLGGVFTSYSTWRWCFYVNLPIGAVAALGLGMLRIPEQTTKPRALVVLPKLHHYLDLIGFALFAPAVLQFLLALQYGGNEHPWGSSQVIGLFCGSGATLTVWFFWNRHKGDEALLPGSLVGRRIVWSAGLYQASRFAAMYGGAYFLPIYFQAINNATAMLSGVYLLPTILPQLVIIGLVIPIAIFSTVLLSVSSGLYSLLQPGTASGMWIGFQLMAGIGTGASMQLAIIAVQAAVSERELATAMAFLVFAQALGPAIALALCNVLFDASLRAQLPRESPHADADAIIQAGATGFRAIVQPADLPGVLVAYANSIDQVFYLVAAMASVGGIVLWGMGWQDLRKIEKSERGKDTIAQTAGKEA
ncbi:MFS general substrate transporter [Cryphonectria parasitica EP155]|uniref:MFS general substrate transporter n=1 Tax=Cryphonectria parasitica (strain ATCC 38755 / EP155) TaxID=660469 RepID=A0A9P4Y165_CRYP1|nr:MFS general substrate transporter [Cryphonectria parasitica EP155]KAF3764671.1 MFS general substrate transporter [Cryphonectria parasitica EP155]